MACVEPAPLAQEHIWHVDSYTKHVVQILETSRGFMLDGEPKTIGGPSRVTRALKQSCIREMQTWIVLAAEVLKTECPNYEILASFAVFDLAHDSRGLTRLDERPAVAHAESFRETSVRRLSRACNVDQQQLMDQMADIEPIARQIQASGSQRGNFEAWASAVARTELAS